MGTITETEKYIITGELRETLLIIISLLQKHSSKRYWKNTDKYSDELKLEDGNIVPLPFLAEIQMDLENAEKVIEEDGYDCKVEELLLVAREMKLL